MEQGCEYCSFLDIYAGINRTIPKNVQVDRDSDISYSLYIDLEIHSQIPKNIQVDEGWEFCSFKI